MRHSYPLAVFLAFLFLLTSLSIPSAHAKDTVVTSREYKLMLNAENFSGADPSEAIQTLWKIHLQPLIDHTLGLRSEGRHRYSGSFQLEKEGTVRFWDTPAPHSCTLKKHGYIFRERVWNERGEEKEEKREVTLKFRSPDRYLSSQKKMPATHDQAETKFEEDIGQVIVRVQDFNGVLHRYTDKSPSFKSVYSHSSTQPIGVKKAFSDLKDLFKLYPALKDGLEDVYQI